jgi:hypothetical protein
MEYDQLDSMSEIWKDIMERHLPMFECLTSPPACEDGWAVLVENLMGDIEHVIEQENEKIFIEVEKIEEKYGGLRFVVSLQCSNDARDRIMELIAEAEANSYGICELCGEPGDLRSDRPWITTLCEYHARMEHGEL